MDERKATQEIVEGYARKDAISSTRERDATRDAEIDAMRKQLDAIMALLAQKQ